MEFPTLINWTRSFLFLLLLGGIFHFYSKFSKTFCTQTVETRIRCRILWRLFWVCTVCLDPRLIWVNSLHAGYFFMLLLSSADFFQNKPSPKNSSRNNIRASNRLYPEVISRHLLTFFKINFLKNSFRNTIRE